MSLLRPFCKTNSSDKRQSKSVCTLRFQNSSATKTCSRPKLKRVKACTRKACQHGKTLFNIRRDYESVNKAIGSAEGELHTIEAAIAEADARLIEQEATRISEALRKVGENQLQLAELDEIIKRLSGRAARTIITAPRDGVIENLALNSSMAVVQPGQTIMTLVPIGEELVIEANVRPDDVGRLAVGQPVDIRLSSYDFTTYGSISGNLINISATSFPDKQGQVFYRARVALEKTFVGSNPTINPVLPGNAGCCEHPNGREDNSYLSHKTRFARLDNAYSEP